jgi:hypothetical protein
LSADLSDKTLPRRLRDAFQILGLSSLAFSDALTGLIAVILIYPGFSPCAST